MVYFISTELRKKISMLWKLCEESTLKGEARVLREAPDMAARDDYIIKFDAES